MSRNPFRSLWSRLFKAGKSAAGKTPRRLALEALEDRAVPALMVTNLLDGTNTSSPIAGSLRDAITRPPSDGIITFDPLLFSDAVGPQTLVLNGAVGRLQINNGANLTIQGPGKFASGPFAGQYKLIIQSDLGFSAASVNNGGQGFKVGDLLHQGFDQFTGGARFQVLAINDLSDGKVDLKGAITSVTVVQPGANATLRATGAVLGPTGTGITQLTPVGGSTGSGAFLQVNPTDISIATGLVQQQMSGATGFITISGLHFGTSRGDSVIVGLGSLTVNDSLFDNTDTFGFPKQSTSYISVLSGGNDLKLNTSTFRDAGSTAVDMIGSGDLTVSGTVFDGNDNNAIDYRTGGTVVITDSTFIGNGDGGSSGSTLAFGYGGVRVSGSSGVTVTNTLFQSNTVQNQDINSINGGSALAVTSSGSLTVTNATFDGNTTANAGFRLPGEPNTNSYNSGGSAILAISTPTVTVSKSLFRGNSVLNINQEDSGGGAIYNYNGTLTLDQCGFEDNFVTITGYPRNSPSPDTTDYSANPELQPSARYSGGGAVYSGGSTTITGSYFSGNSVQSQVDFWQHSLDEKNTPSKALYSGGGALYLTSNGLAATNNLYNLTFNQNSAVQTGATTDTNLSGKGSTYIPLGATPSSILVDPSYGLLTINAANQSFSVASQTGGFGTPNFTAAPPVSLAAMPSSAPGAVTQGDFNSDFLQDFIVANPQVNSASLYLGTVTGTFQLASSFSVGTTPGAAPVATASGDFNKDGNLDFAVANSGENSITYFLGNGNGTFAAGANIATTGAPVALAAGDFNNDTFVDLTAVTSSGTINQFNWNGTGAAFDTAVKTTFSSTPASLVLGDLNADGFLDAVTADSAANLIHTYFGQANGTFINNPLTNDYNTGAGTDPRVARLANLDADNLLDIFVPLHGTSELAVYTNLGAGLYGFSNAFTVLPGPVDATAGLINFDANIDIAVATDTTSSISILYGNGAGGFQTPPIPTGRGLNGGAIILADGRAPGNPNNVNFNAFNGSSTTNIVNCTITGNSLVNPFATNSNSNFSTALLQTGPISNWVTTTDTGGIFVDTNTGSSILTTNMLINNNTGLDYINGGGFGFGDPIVAISNIGRRYLADGAGTINSVASTMYDPLTTYGFNNNASNINGSFISRPGDILQSDNTANLDPAGLQTDVRAPEIGLTSNPLFAGRIKYIPIERLSPARDAGTSVNVYPTPLATDIRGSNRLININVDIGAYEVQYATSTTVTSPILAPADSTHPNPFTFTTYGEQVTLTAKSQWNDNKLPSETIQGLVELLRASDNSLVAVGSLVQVPGDIKAGTVTFAINNNLTNLLATGTNTLYFRYSGDMNYATSESSRFDIIVNPAATTTTLGTPTPNPSDRFTSIAFAGTVAATVSTQAPIGSIDLGYQVGANPFVVLASNIPVASDGSYSTSLVPANVGLAYGVYNIIAKFLPTDANQFTISTSAAQVLTIGVTPSVTLSNLSPNPVQATNSVTFSAIVLQTDPAEPLSGSLDFLANGVSLGNVPFASAVPLAGGGGVQYTLLTANTNGLNLGTQSVTARYNQDGGSYATTTSPGQNLTVLGFDTTTDISATALSVPYGTTVDILATVNHAAIHPLGAGTVTFYQGSTVLGTGTVSEAAPTATLSNLLLAGGTHQVDASFGGDGTTYIPSTSDPITIQVTPATVGTTLTGPTVAALGKASTYTTTLTSPISGAGIAGLAGSVVYSISLNGAAPVVVSTVPVTATSATTYTASLTYTAPSTGNYILSAAYTGDTNYSATISPLSFRVNRVVEQRFYAIAPAVGSTIQLFSTATNTQMAVIRPLGAGYTGGFRASTTGDVTGDGVADLVYTTKTTSFVRIVDGRTLNPLGGFYAYSTGYPIPVNLATGDVNGDLRDDIIVAPGGTGQAPLVKVFNSANLAQVLWSKNAYSANYKGGVTLAAADVNNDGRADVITGPMSAAQANVRVFTGTNGALLRSFVVTAHGTGYTGGIWVAANVATSGAVDIVTSANTGVPRVVATDYSTLATRANFLAFSSSYRGGVRVAMADTNGDGVKELLVGIGPKGGGPLVARYTPDYTRIDQFFAFGPANGSASFNGGVFPG